MITRNSWWRNGARFLAPLLLMTFLLAACGGGATPAKDQAKAPATDAKPAETKAPPKLKLAMIMPGPAEDADYNFVGYRALLDLKAEFGIEVKHQESVAPADAERVARGFINDGYNVIAFHGGQFLTVAQKLAPAFPDVNFIIETSGQLANMPPNLWNIGRKFYEGYYPIGTLAALTTKTGKIGVVVGIKLPDFIAVVNAIKDAAKEANPKVQVLHTFVGDQNDPVLARQGAEALINQGADFLVAVVNMGSYGVIEAAKGKDVKLATQATDKIAMAPTQITTSKLLDFSTNYKNVIGQILKGNRGGYEEMRAGNGILLSKITNVPEDTAKKVNEIMEKVSKRELKLTEKTDAVKE